MFPATCNIDKTDRINRSVFGIILIAAALLGAGKIFFIVMGFILLIEGVIGWCGIPYFISRFK